VRLLLKEHSQLVIKINKSENAKLILLRLTTERQVGTEERKIVRGSFLYQCAVVFVSFEVLLLFL